MALLEIHDGRGRVERVEIAHDDQVLFGAGPTCTIVLSGPGVAQIHGRIRWQRRKYKVDAGTDVDALELNGKRIKSASLYQGDEIRVGPNRIFVISTEESSYGRPANEDEKTIIRPAPKTRGASPKSNRPGNVFEGPGISEILDVPSPQTPLQRGRKRREQEAGERPAKPSHATPPEPSSTDQSPGLLAKLMARLPRSQTAPGEERILSSPIVLGLAVMFVVLTIASYGLWKVIVKTTAQKQYALAFESLDDGDYRNALKRFDQFLEANPTDHRVAKATVFRALANVRQFTSISGASWDKALQAAQAMVQEVGRLPDYRDASTELAEQLVKTTEGLADRARSAADPVILRSAETALALHAQVAGKSAEATLSRSRAPAKLQEARNTIRRVQAKTRALASMDAALKAENPADAFAARDVIVGLYPDIAADKDVVGRLLLANESIRKRSTFEPAERPGIMQPRIETLGRPTTLVYRTNPALAPKTEGSGAVVYAMADGLAYGLDALTGAPLWQRPVGLSAPFLPQAILGGEPAAILVDSRSHDLLRIDGRTGALIWRQELGEPITDPPLLLGNQVYQVLPSGKVVEIDLGSGTIRGTLNVGRPLTRTPVGDETGRHLYVLGDEDCLFILTREPLSCASVEYLGHERGSIACAPARIGRFLVIAENHELDDGRWRVLVLDEYGGKAAVRQTLPVAGWTWKTPSTAGAVIWSAGDRGEVVAYSIGTYDDDAPFKPIGKISPDTAASGPAFGTARSEREYWLSSGRSGRYDLNAQSGKLTTVLGIGGTEPSLSSIQFAEKLAVLSRRSKDGPGLTLTAFDVGDGTIRWRTTLGAPWPFPVLPTSDGSMETLEIDGKTLRLGRSQLLEGGFVVQPLPQPGAFHLPPTGALTLSLGETTIVVPSPGADSLLVSHAGEPFKTISLPTPLGAPPIVWQASILIPGVDGRFYLIDPTTGESAADPYVPPFEKTRSAGLHRPILLDGDAVAIVEHDGRIRRLIQVTSPRRRLVVTTEVKLGKPVSAAPASTGSTLLLATDDGSVRALASRDLSAAGSTDLPDRRTIGPTVVAQRGFVGDAAGNVLVFAADGRKLRQSHLSSPAQDPPGVRDGIAWFATRSGSIESLSLTDGSTGEVRPIDDRPAGSPIVTGEILLIPTGLGSFRPLLDGDSKGPTSASGKALR